MKPVQLTDLQEARATRLKLDAQTGDNANGFLSAILLALPHCYTRDIPTAAVSKRRFYMNPDWLLDTLDAEQRLFVFYHEALHLIYEHLDTRGGRDVGIWQAAADFRINIDVQLMGISRPPEGLYDDEGKYTDMSTIDIYDSLMDEYGNDPDSLPQWNTSEDMIEGADEPDDGSGGGEDDEDGNSLSSQDLSENIREIIQNAAMVAEATDTWGTTPGNIQLMVQAERSVKVNWREHLANIPHKLRRSSFDYNSFSRRGIVHGHYNPRRREKRLGTIGVAWDTSISVTDEQIALMKGECINLREALNPEKFVVVCFDTEVHEVHEIESHDDISLIQIEGRGGTYLHPVFEYFNENHDDLAALLVFSDLFCREVPIEMEPSCETFFVAIDNPSAHVNFGQIIHFDSYED